MSDREFHIALKYLTQFLYIIRDNRGVPRDPSTGYKVAPEGDQDGAFPHPKAAKNAKLAGAKDWVPAG